MSEAVKTAKPKRNSVAAVIPDDVYQKFDDYRWSNKMSKSEALVDLIRKGLSTSK